MARYAYDVNKTQRLLDVHKQFQGGLKTVDTDDALGAVFLRDAENVSLSEFGFIEKRYGTYQDTERVLQPGLTKLQGYWEFQGFKIYAVNGGFYVNEETTARQIEEEDAEFRYPTPLPNYPFQVDSVENYRDMNAVNINNVLYIFTGFYPVYVKKVDDDLKFYWFSVDIPTYDEIVVVGHNFLENDYEGLYFTEESPFTQPSTDFNEGLEYPEISQNGFSPRLPNTEDDLNLHFATYYPTDMDAFSPNSNNSYFEIKLDSVGYRNSGPGASDLDFFEVDLSEVNFEKKSNYYVDPLQYNSQDDDLPSRGIELLSRAPFSETYYFSTQRTTTQDIYKYRITLDFEVNRKDFLESDTHLIELYRFNGVDFTPFVLKDYTGVQDDISPQGIRQRDAVLKIKPVDYNDNVLKEELVTLNLYNQAEYTFSAPDTLNKNTTIKKYIFNLELYDTAYAPLDTPGIHDDLSDIETNPENYHYNLVTIEPKKPVLTSLQSITSSKVPDLDFSISNLINGTFDFKARFVREEWRRVTENGQFLRLELIQKEFFETIIKQVVITTEKIQDYPGAENVPAQVEAIWSCNKVIEHFGKLLIWGSEKMPTAVFYSFPDRPMFFPSKFYLDFVNDENSAVEAVSNYMNILVVQTEDRTWGVRGNSGLIDAPSPYVPFTINPTVGTIAYKSVRPVRNHLFFLSKQGVIALKSLYAADEQYNIDFMDRNIRNIVPQDVNAVGIQFDNQYWLNFPEQRITLRWYIDKKAWVLDRYNAWQDFNGVFRYFVKQGQLEFVTLPSRFGEGNLAVYKVGVDYSLPSDLGGIIPAKFETSFLNQNYPFHLKNYKEFKYDFTMQNEYNFSRVAIYNQPFELPIGTTSVSLDNVDALIKNHRYRLSFSKGMPIDNILISGEEINFTAVDGSFYEEGFTDFEFFVPNHLGGIQDIIVNFDPAIDFIYNSDIALTDITYDDVMTFLTKVVSEERNVLNQQLPIGYDERQEEIAVDLADFEDFTLGSSYFGDRVTFVKTVKLSGRGYNSKAYFEDFSRAKWTIESMGITYKMKKARST